MGQQQLILLVLATIIVGVAIVVGINAFSENSVKNNYDQLLQRTLTVANEAQAWKQKPEVFGGQGGTYGGGVFTGLTFNALGMANGGDDGGTATDYTCLKDGHGTYELTSINASPLTVTGRNPATGNLIKVTVSGVTTQDVTLTESKRGDSSVPATSMTCFDASLQTAL